MNLQQLDYFLASIEHGSFSAAADTLHLAQPSVSEQVRRLEDELGVRLFQRVGRGLVPTEAGRTLQPRAEAVRESVRQARESVAAVRELRGGTASFGTFAGAGDYLGSQLIADFRTRYPNVRVRILGLNSADAADEVRAGRLEAAIVALPVDDEGLELRPVVEDELVFVSGEAARLRRAMTIERLAALPLVLADASFGIEDPTRRSLAELAQRAGVTIRPVIDVESDGTVMELVGAGAGDTVSWLGHLLARRGAGATRIGWVPFADPIHVTLAFVFRRGAPLSPAALAMSSIVEQRLRVTAAALAHGPRRRLPG